MVLRGSVMPKKSHQTRSRIIKRNGEKYRIVRWGKEHGGTMELLYRHFKKGKDFTAGEAEELGIPKQRLDELVAFQMLSHYPYLDFVYSTHVVRNTNTSLEVEVPVNGYPLENPPWLAAVKAKNEARKAAHQNRNR